MVCHVRVLFVSLVSVVLRYKSILFVVKTGSEVENCGKTKTLLLLKICKWTLNLHVAKVLRSTNWTGR